MGGSSLPQLVDPRVAWSMELYSVERRMALHSQEKDLMTRLNWLKERWAAASAGKKYVAIAGFAILGMALLASWMLLGTPFTRQQVGFAFLAVVAAALVAIVAVGLYEGRRYPRQQTFPRHPAGRAEVSQAAWNAARDENLLVGSSPGGRGAPPLDARPL